MTVGLFAEVFNQFSSSSEKYRKIGWNTGNILFMSALRSMIDCEIVRDWEEDRIAQHSAFMTTELIWIRESATPSEGILKRVKATAGKPLVPISIGLQSHDLKPDFQIQPEMLAVIKELESRCILPVRGAYTAEILAKHGVRSVEIIGCPSIYQIPLYHESLAFLSRAPAARPRNVAANFRSFAGKLSDVELACIKHITRHCAGFVEQTMMPPADAGVSDAEILRWFELNSHLFFDLDSWIRHNLRYDFSYGLRFHGNVATILAGAPALFIVIDSRTREMTEHFRLPSLALADFRENMPLEDLVGMADYGRFTADYGEKLKTFETLAAANSLPLSPHFKSALSKFTSAPK